MTTTTWTLVFALMFIAMFSRLAMAGIAVGLFFMAQTSIAQTLGFDPLQQFVSLFGDSSPQVQQIIALLQQSITDVGGLIVGVLNS